MINAKIVSVGYGKVIRVNYDLKLINITFIYIYKLYCNNIIIINVFLSM